MAAASPAPGRAGVTMFETLVALSILALVLGVAATALRGPSPAMQLEQWAAELAADAARARARAVAEGESVSVALPGCDGGTVTARFFSDGTASGPDACVTVADTSLTLRISPLTGRLRVMRAP